MPLPEYRGRYLPAMTPAEIAQLPHKEEAPVIVPTGAIEQHGPHLPVGVDSIMGQAWLNAALPLLDADEPCYVAPPVTIGKSDEHTGFPGTLFCSTTTLRRILLVIARQIRAWGFRTFCVLNTHGGNISVLRYTLREIQAETGLLTCMLSFNRAYPVSDQEAAYGFHANQAETAWMLAVTEGLVRMEEARCEYPDRVENRARLKPERAPATFTWITSDVSESGIMGDATAATREMGQEWLRLYAEGLAEDIRKVRSWAREERKARQVGFAGSRTTD